MVKKGNSVKIYYVTRRRRKNIPGIRVHAYNDLIYGQPQDHLGEKRVMGLYSYEKKRDIFPALIYGYCPTVQLAPFHLALCE